MSRIHFVHLIVIQGYNLNLKTQSRTQINLGVSDVPALYHSGPTIPAPVWKITGRAGRVSFPAPIFENPSGPIFETIPVYRLMK